MYVLEIQDYKNVNMQQYDWGWKNIKNNVIINRPFIKHKNSFQRYVINVSGYLVE